jgi:hypothetical protein
MDSYYPIGTFDNKMLCSSLRPTTFLRAFLVAGLIIVAVAVAACRCALAGVVGHGDDNGNDDAMMKE